MESTFGKKQHEGKIMKKKYFKVRIEERQTEEEEHIDLFRRMLVVEGPPCCTMCHVVTAIGVN